MSETVFTKVDYTLGTLMDSIWLGTLSLPDIQRPFVWKNVAVRDLFDSMYQGFPVGYLIFWKTATSDETRSIGTDEKQKYPSLLIVDGQQRLTALYAVIKSQAVVRENYDSEQIEIAFNPVTEKFEVADAAIKKDKQYVPNIAVIWNPNTNLFQLADKYLTALADTQEIGEEDRKKIGQSFMRLQNLITYPFTALELNANISEEQVADIFVRINSKGKNLNQADFILTLMSVFWDEGRKQLEDFCRSARIPNSKGATPFNHFIEPDPDQMLRVSIALGFKRARLQSVYAILRGKDIETGEFSAGRRDEQFGLLKQAQKNGLNLQYWTDFLKCLIQAGFKGGNTISSKNGVIFAYIFYLMGRTEFGVDEFMLRSLIAKWFFMSSMTGRYSTSPETKMEFDLARFRGISDPNVFVSILEDICAGVLTNDFWSTTLPMDLATSASRSPSMFAYFAALNLLDARVLFSKQKVSELLDPSMTGTRSAVERHHLFPRAYLSSKGIDSLRDTNQIANFTLVEWGDNSLIGKESPVKYVPKFEARFKSDELERMYYWHAMPDKWATMEYPEFLRKRRELMSSVIRDAYNKLSGQGPSKPVAAQDLSDVIQQGETTTTEFKSTLRTNLHTSQRDPKVELSSLKTVAGFLNSGGGKLIIGVADDGDPVGIEADEFANEDKMYLHLVNLLKDRMGAQYMMYIHPRFDDYEEVRVLIVDCMPARSPVYVKDGNIERFYVRTGNSTTELTSSQIQTYIQQRFKG